MEQALGSFFYDKVLPAANAIKTAQEVIGNIFLSYNGGKDCTVLLEILEYFGIDVPVVVFDEPDAFPELISFTRWRLDASPLKKLYLSADFRAEMNHLVNKGIKGAVLGQRFSDPAQPRSYFEKSSQGWADFTRIFPIFNWAYHDVWYFLDRINANYCILYTQGYTSLGSVAKTQPNPTLNGRHARELINEDDERLGRL